jgi:hypothetical protein
MKFNKAFLNSCLEVLADSGLNDLQKYEELQEMLLDEGYDADQMYDLLLALS